MLLQDHGLVWRHLLIDCQRLRAQTELSKLIQQGLWIDHRGAEIINLIGLAIKLLVLNLLCQPMSKTLESIVLVNLHLEAVLDIRQSINLLCLFGDLWSWFSSMLRFACFRVLGISDEISPLL